MNPKIPDNWKELNDVEPINLEAIAEAIKKVPRKEWDRFFKQFQRQLLQGALASDKETAEKNVAAARAVSSLQNFLMAVLD